MTLKSEKFEKQIKRIHELIEQPDSKVTWNDHIPDPDNPNKSRQIDITIEREGKLTLVECRTHKEKQNVKWIEELIGRRLSLKADAVIAVSASRFTDGAIKKAKAFGIILRDFLTLTAEEISNWGYSTGITLTFYKFEDAHLIFHFRPEDRAKINKSHFDNFSSDYLIEIFNLTANKIEFEHTKDLHEMSGVIGLSFANNGLQIGPCPVLRIDLNSKFKRIVRQVKIPAIVAYDSPSVNPSKRKAFIEQTDLENLEITQSSNDVRVICDLSHVDMPPHTIIGTIAFDFKRIVNIHGFEHIGDPPFKVPAEEIRWTASFLPIDSMEKNIELRG